ncbi:HAD family hydrolase [Aeromicrobium duanguangcaii]|uniref:HAD family phosphatase n=1 Tax=Aeromicrobium duanguangcaii TaxID=2968086 RepID=A0ABY5KDY6_9ACTN|nr:HAD family phosphatase [Aeromicrobium duanguangcaii]MCD9152797.1 HAD family phosphatase [Aeromicrobium duanguangcaii]UUI67221.1 HAD family phosphatase [Aeromicrobium duanguangcaii]
MNAPWKHPKAVLWDMDGTLVDTEPMWIAGEHQLAEDHGAVWTEEDSLHLVGSDLLVAARYIKQRIGGDMTPEDIVDFLGGRVATALRRQQEWRPGARELIEEYRAAGVPQALVTMSYGYIAEPVVDALGFEAVVTGDSVTQGKPHPEPYLKAAELLGVRAEDCIAIEDSRTGAASANAAGCFVIAVPHAVAVPEAPFRAVVPTLAGLTADHVGRLAGLGHE